MSITQTNLSQTSINKNAIDFSNKFNVNVTSLTIFPPVTDCYIQISPNNNYIAFVQNNTLEIFSKDNGQWNRTLQHKLFLDDKKIRGINWSLDNKMILIFANYEIKNEKKLEKQALIKAINLNDINWNCEIGFKGNINHASFYPDSLNIVYIKSLINTLNIFSLLEYSNMNSKFSQTDKKKIKYQYLFLKFDDERSINYIENNGNIFMILPCYGRKILTTGKTQKYENKEPSDYIVILINKTVFKCFEAKTFNLNKIIPLNNKFSFFIVIEKDFYKLPFYIYNLYGEIMFKSEFNKQAIPKKLTNPCLLYNKNKETNFIVVQVPGGKLEIFGCQNILNRSDICYFYDYNQLTDFVEKNKKKKNIINNGTKSQNNFNSFQENNNVFEDENYVDVNDILFLEEQSINNSEDDLTNNGISKEDINIKKNKRKRKLIKVNPFNLEPCFEENDYLLHSEISSNKNYICFINRKYPKYLFFGCYYLSGVFKIIKFMNDVISFKWSTEQDILMVTLDSPFIYLITKDYYLNYYLEENYNLNNIMWSPSGKEIILSNEEKNIRMVAILE